MQLDFFYHNRTPSYASMSTISGHDANLTHEIKSLVGGMKLKGIIAFLQSLSLIESELYTEVIKLAKLIIPI